MTKLLSGPTEQNTKKRRHQMLYMRDTAIQFPELWLSVYVSGPPSDAVGFPEMFARARCFKADSPDEADLVVFTGGPDVNPGYYTECLPHETVCVDEARDQADLELYAKCYDEGIPMFGVCRGAQFGAVMNGAELFMDVDNHNSSHIMFTKTGTLTVSSVHHQMVMPCPGMDVIGWSNKSEKRWLSASLHEEGYNRDVEAFFFRDSCFFGVQGHPEYKGVSSFTAWSLQQIEQLIMHNPDLVLDKTKSVYRLKEDIRKQRDEQITVTKEVA